MQPCASVIRPSLTAIRTASTRDHQFLVRLESCHLVRRKSGSSIALFQTEPLIPSVALPDGGHTADGTDAMEYNVIDSGKVLQKERNRVGIRGRPIQHLLGCQWLDLDDKTPVELEQRGLDKLNRVHCAPPSLLSAS